MSTSPLLPCKDPPLLHRLSLRGSSGQHEMDEDPRPILHHGGGDRGTGAPFVPPRLGGQSGGGLAPGLAPGLRRMPPVPTRWASPPPVSSQPTSDRSMITLAGHSGPRQVNDYVDSPSAPVPPPHGNSGEMISLLEADQAFIRHLGSSRPARHGSGSILTQPKSSGGLKERKDQSNATKTHSTSTATIISSTAASAHKGHIGSLAAGVAASSRRDSGGDLVHVSIFCKKCGECKCNACTSPRQLPSSWVCEKRYECSAEQLVEYCSCLCCVKSLFYHCENSEDNLSTADAPCACCERPHCCKRWTCLGVMSLFLPCLCLYWPLRALVRVSAACYRGCCRRGCQCNRDKSGQTLTKSPLIDSESSSA